MRVVEGSAFVAAPLGGMTLAQMGADVIRFDQLAAVSTTRGGRSPTTGRASSGPASTRASARSPRISASPAGRELLTELICAPGEDAGLFLTNFPARGWLDHERAGRAPSRPDHGGADRQPGRRREVDYTVNPATGFPLATGPRNLAEPLQQRPPGLGRGHRHAGRRRPAGGRATPRQTGEGQLIRLALSDVAFAMVGNLGRIAEVQLDDSESPARTATTSTGRSATTSRPGTAGG